MSDPSRYTDPERDADRRRIPRWALLSVVAAAILVLIVIAVMLSGGGGHPRPDHGFGGDDIPGTSATDRWTENHTPPQGAHR
ncbi:MAG TPA: hypothetical protein VFZ37_05280 [Jiangellaceae bacterium]